MEALPLVTVGDPHVTAHNEERSAINDLMLGVLPEGLTYDGDTLTSGEPFATPDESGVTRGFSIGLSPDGEPEILSLFSPAVLDEGVASDTRGVGIMGTGVMAQHVVTNLDGSMPICRAVTLSDSVGLEAYDLTFSSEWGPSGTQVMVSGRDGFLSQDSTVDEGIATVSLTNLSPYGAAFFRNYAEDPNTYEMISGESLTIDCVGLKSKVIGSSSATNFVAEFEWTDVQLKSETPQILVLTASDPVPVDTPAGTIIMRTP